MRRIIVLDISTLYTQIYDEIYCREDELESTLSKYRSDNFLCISMVYDKNLIKKVHIG